MTQWVSRCLGVRPAASPRASSRQHPPLSCDRCKGGPYKSQPAVAATVVERHRHGPHGLLPNNFHLLATGFLHLMASSGRFTQIHRAVIAGGLHLQILSALLSCFHFPEKAPVLRSRTKTWLKSHGVVPVGRLFLGSIHLRNGCIMVHP